MVWSPETKARHAATVAAMWADPAKRAARCAALRAAHARQTPEQKQAREAKHAATVNTKYAQDPGYRQRLCRSAQARGQRPEEQERRREVMNRLWQCEDFQQAWGAARRDKGPTAIELIVAQVLDALGEPYQTEEPFGRYHADFYLPERQLVIECDGIYWHGRPDVKERDARRDAWFAEQGITVLRLGEQEIHAQGRTLLDRLLSLAGGARNSPSPNYPH